ncbi:MAG: hypothetical protein K5752_05445 [Succinivibrionaceae bacterium]|nr:hypothetical protein [Succinivibrionaceae bacterium]
MNISRIYLSALAVLAVTGVPHAEGGSGSVMQNEHMEMIMENTGETENSANPDKDSGRLLFCPVCGSEFHYGAGFCHVCGADLRRYSAGELIEKPEHLQQNNNTADTASLQIRGAAPGTDPEPRDGVKPPPDDRGLTLIADCCRKVVATPYGDSHDEVVLYLDEKTGEYQIHTYRLEYRPPEIHHGYRSDRRAFDEIMKRIRETDLASYRDRHYGFPTGGDYVCRFVLDGSPYRIALENLPSDRHSNLFELGNLLRSFIDAEQEIFGAEPDAQTDREPRQE